MPGSKPVWVYTNQVLCVWFTFTLPELRGYHPGKARWRRVVHVFNLWTHSHSMYTKIHIGYTRLFCRDRHFLPIWCLLPRSLGHKEWYMSVLSMSRRSHKRFVLLFYLAWCIRLFWTNGIILSYFILYWPMRWIWSAGFRHWYLPPPHRTFRILYSNAMILQLLGTFIPPSLWA